MTCHAGIRSARRGARSPPAPRRASAHGALRRRCSGGPARQRVQTTPPVPRRLRRRQALTSASSPRSRCSTRRMRPFTVPRGSSRCSASLYEPTGHKGERDHFSLGVGQLPEGAQEVLSPLGCDALLVDDAAAATLSRRSSTARCVACGWFRRATSIARLRATVSSHGATLRRCARPSSRQTDRATR